MAPRPGDHDFRGEAFDVLAAASRDIEDERRRQSELARIRAEIVDIARDVTSLRHRGSNSAADNAMPDPTSHQNLTVREPRSNSARRREIGRPSPVPSCNCVFPSCTNS